MQTLITIIAIVGILDTIYLISRKLQGKRVHCPFFPQKWCDKVQKSKQSKTFGVPNSVWGFIIYTTIFTLSLVQSSGTNVLWPLTGVIALGTAFSLYFLYIQAFVLRAFCTWCVLSAINFTILAIAIAKIHELF